MQYFSGPVVYDTSQFLCTNRDVLPDDLITVFGKESCQFGFASHLFATELRNLQNNQPRGACFRISPTAGTSAGMCNVWDFQLSLDWGLYSFLWKHFSLEIIVDQLEKTILKVFEQNQTQLEVSIFFKISKTIFYISIRFDVVLILENKNYINYLFSYVKKIVKCIFTYCICVHFLIINFGFSDPTLKKSLFSKE